MSKMLLKKYLLLFFAAFMMCQSGFAQDILKEKDLSRVRVDQMSDADVAKVKAQLTSSGISIEQAEQMALSKGMSAAEFAKLKARLDQQAGVAAGANVTGKLRTQQPKTEGRVDNSTDSLSQPRYDRLRPRTLIDSLIFGSELYTSVAPSFEPNLKLATPMNYVLGPDDVISVSVFGVQVYEGELTVSAEGVVTVPNVGQVKVSGMTIEAATQKLKSSMTSVYSTLRSGGSQLSVTLAKIRSIKVNVIGSNFPGTYTVSSLSTVFNVLYLAGGPRQFGSFREIELVRVGQPIRKIDLYRFLLNGDQSDNIGLKDNDVIRIPTYKTRVEIQGQVKRPGIFEVLPGEHFSDIVAFAFGFTDTAYTAGVKIYQRDEKERSVKDLTAAEYKNYLPKTGDVFVVSKILNRFRNRVRITGAVYRPDVYELMPDMKAVDLIRKADGLREDAYTGRAQVLRLSEDLTRTIISFDISKALAGDASNNPLLQREDELLISSVSDLKDSFKVSIQGEIRLPGQYEWVPGLSLKDLILQAGGFTDAAFQSIEIARLIKRDSLGITDKRAAEVINVDISGRDLSSPLANIPLQAFDMIAVRRKAGYTVPETVLLSGRVQYPGPYAISRSNERVSDLLARAGGYAPEAYPAGAYLKRYKTQMEKQQAEDVSSKVQKKLTRDTAMAQDLVKEIRREYDQIPLDMEAVVKNPGSIQDIIVKANDELYIPKFDAQVKVSGEVLVTTQLPYEVKNSFKDYIDAAGGYSSNALKNKAYIVYANGKAATMKHFLFFKFYPKVLPGSELIVPKKPEKKGLSTGEVIGVSSALASLAGVVIAILKL